MTRRRVRLVRAALSTHPVGQRPGPAGPRTPRPFRGALDLPGATARSCLTVTLARNSYSSLVGVAASQRLVLGETPQPSALSPDRSTRHGPGRRSRLRDRAPGKTRSHPGRSVPATTRRSAAHGTSVRTEIYRHAGPSREPVSARSRWQFRSQPAGMATPTRAPPRPTRSRLQGVISRTASTRHDGLAEAGIDRRLPSGDEHRPQRGDSRTMKANLDRGAHPLPTPHRGRHCGPHGQDLPQARSARSSGDEVGACLGQGLVTCAGRSHPTRKDTTAPTVDAVGILLLAHWRLSFRRKNHASEKAPDDGRIMADRTDFCETRGSARIGVTQARHRILA